jgi:hypothetical protein
MFTMKKRILIIINILLLLATMIPVCVLLWDCINSAIQGIYPWGLGYGTDYGEKIFGLEAFRYVFITDCVFGFVLVLLWVCLFVGTAAFTVFTAVYVNREKLLPDYDPHPAQAKDQGM